MMIAQARDANPHRRWAAAMAHVLDGNPMAHDRGLEQPERFFDGVRVDDPASGLAFVWLTSPCLALWSPMEPYGPLLSPPMYVSSTSTAPVGKFVACRHRFADVVAEISPVLHDTLSRRLS
jgi:hypothetical protein